MTQATSDRVPMHALVNILNEFKSSHSANSQLKHEIMSNFNSEYDIQKKIMLLSLTLASDPSVTASAQKQRRDFYEKSKSKVGQQRKQKKYSTFSGVKSFKCVYFFVVAVQIRKKDRKRMPEKEGELP